MWQIEARSNREFRAYRRLDLHYVQNWSVGLDLRILLATAAYVGVELLLFPFRRLLPSSVDGVVDFAGSTGDPVASEPTIDVDAIEAASHRLSPPVQLIDLVRPHAATSTPPLPSGPIATARTVDPTAETASS